MSNEHGSAALVNTIKEPHFFYQCLDKMLYQGFSLMEFEFSNFASKMLNRRCIFAYY